MLDSSYGRSYHAPIAPAQSPVPATPRLVRPGLHPRQSLALPFSLLSILWDSDQYPFTIFTIL